MVSLVVLPSETKCRPRTAYVRVLDVASRHFANAIEGSDLIRSDFHWHYYPSINKKLSINANYLSLNLGFASVHCGTCSEPTEYYPLGLRLAKNARKERPKPSPSRLDLPHPDHRARESRRKTISDLPVVIFHPNSLHMHLHDFFLRFIKPCVRLCRHDSHHFDFLHFLGSHPPPKIST